MHCQTDQPDVDVAFGDEFDLAEFDDTEPLPVGGDSADDHREVDTRPLVSADWLVLNGSDEM